MGRSDEHKYYVIEFLEPPYEEIDEYVCIPWTWIVTHKDKNFVVSYPVENPLVTEKRVKDRVEISKEWKSYKTIARYATNSYEHAKLISTNMNDFHNNQCSDMKSADHDSSDIVEKSTYKSSDQQDDDYGSATRTKLKRMAQSNPETKAALKRSNEVQPAESVSEVAAQSCPAFGRPNENSSSEPITIADPELFTILFSLLQDFQKSSSTNHSVIDMVRETLVMNDKVMKEQAKIIAELRALLPSKDTAEAEDSEKDSGDDDHEVVNIKRLRKPFVLPPEYDKNDSRWTLKHRKLDAGLVELMPNTRVYINAVELNHCKRFARDCRSLARMLSLEIFTKTALSVCSLTGSRARAYDLQGTNVRPGLDENARNALLDFVEEHRRAKGWRCEENHVTNIKNGLRNIMKQIRCRYGS